MLLRNLVMTSSVLFLSLSLAYVNIPNALFLVLQLDSLRVNMADDRGLSEL